MADLPRLQGVALQPRASTSPRPMVRTEQVDTRSSVGDFLSSLGTLQPSVANLGQAFIQQKNDPDRVRDEQARVEMSMMGKTSAEQANIDVSELSPKAKQAAGYRIGQTAAIEATDAINKAVAGQDPSTIDVNALIAEQTEKYRKQFGPNASAMRGFVEGTANLQSQLTQHKTSAAAQNFIAKRDDSVNATFNAGFDAAYKSKGVDAGVETVKKLMKENTDFLNMPPQAQGKLLQGLILKAADAGEVDKVNALGGIDAGQGKLSDVMGLVFRNAAQKAQLVTDQRDKDDLQPKLLSAMEAASAGQMTAEQLDELKAISTKKPKILPITTVKTLENSQAAALKAQQNALAEDQRDNALELFTTNNAPRLSKAVADGTVKQLVTDDGVVPLANGKYASVPAKKIIDTALKQNAEATANAVVSDFQRKNPKASEGEVAETRQRSILMTYAKNNEIPEQQKESAIGVLRRSRDSVEPTDVDVAGAQDLLRIKRNAPGLIDAIIPDPKDRAFVDSLDVSDSYGMDIKQAVKRATLDRDNFSSTVPLDRSTLNDATKRVMEQTNSDGSGSWLKYIASATLAGGDIKSVNEAQMQYLVQKQLKQLYARGVRNDDLVDQAVKAISANTINFNGQMIDLTGLHVNDPKSTGSMFQAATAMLLKTKAYKDIDPSTISWQRVGDRDAFVAVSTSGQQLHAPAINLAQMHTMYIQKLKEDRATALVEGKQKGADLQRYQEYDSTDPYRLNGLPQ
ncbi:hypothetical protein [Rhizobium sp. Rhizsp82]|uniref:hypothetical protein n=1 Tax=Rhizobium sp. Rhizsp82 TaxID=3243057 RepID=UPI0039B3A53C